MKQKFSKCLFLAAMLFTVSFSASSQIFVKVRPAFPVIVRPVQPGPGYVWVKEEWETDGNAYRYTGGKWVAPAQTGYYYKRGYWKTNAQGMTWVKGNWYQGQPGNNGKHKGQYEA